MTTYSVYALGRLLGCAYGANQSSIAFGGSETKTTAGKGQHEGCLFNGACMLLGSFDSIEFVLQQLRMGMSTVEDSKPVEHPVPIARFSYLAYA